MTAELFDASARAHTFLQLGRCKQGVGYVYQGDADHGTGRKCICLELITELKQLRRFEGRL
jgi:hypothetical protein